MKRYIIKSECGDYLDDYWHADRESICVESSEVDTFSGLYDADGNELHRPKHRLGFLP